MWFKVVSNKLCSSIQIMKLRCEILINPQNVHEANYILFVMLKHFNIIPMTISIGKQSDNFLILDKKRLLVYILFFTLTLCLILLHLWYGLTNESTVNKMTVMINECSVMVISAFLLIKLAFFKVGNFSIIFAKISKLDNYLDKIELKQINKTISYCHVALLMMIVLNVIFLLLYYSLFFDIFTRLSYHIKVVAPLTNALSVIYFYFSFSLMLHQRFKSIMYYVEKQLSISYNHEIFIGSLSKILDDLLEIAEQFNTNFGSLINSAVCVLYIYVVVFAYSINKYCEMAKYYPTMFFTILHIAWLISNMFIILYMMFFMCDKCTSEVII